MNLKNSYISHTIRCLRQINYTNNVDNSSQLAPRELIVSPSFLNGVASSGSADLLGRNLQDRTLIYMPSCNGAVGENLAHLRLTFNLVINHVGRDTSISATTVVGLSLS